MMFMMGYWMIVPLLIGAVAYAIGLRPRSDQTRPAQTGLRPLDILNERYGSGEITREEYEQMRRDLGS